MRSERVRPAPLVAWLALALALGARGAGGAPGARDQQPVPPVLPFHDPRALDPTTDDDVRNEIESSFADLNRVGPARERLVHRFGLVSVPALARALDDQSANRVTWWNAAATVAALRNRHGPAFELHRAVLGPLVRRLRGGHEEWTTAFCALAFGTFPWTEILPEDLDAVDASIAGYARARGEAATLLGEGRDRLGELARSASAPEAAAALLALGRIGGPRVREIVGAIDPAGYGPVPPRQAALLARGLAGIADGATWIRFVQSDVQADVRAAAALGLAAALARDEIPDLAADYDRLAAALDAVDVAGQASEVAEALFARGLLAPLRDREAEFVEATWPRLLRPTDTEAKVAVAAVQALLFADGHAAWLDGKCTDFAVSPPKQLRRGVLPFALYRAALAGTSRGVKACVDDWLRSKAQRPSAGDDDDPRPYVAVGLLRALERGTIVDADTRATALRGLERAASSILPKGPFQDALARLLEQHGAALSGSSFPVAASPAIAALPSFIADVHGILVEDVLDLVVLRLNAMLDEIYNLNNLPPPIGDDKTRFQGERYLQRFLLSFRYFQRVDLFERRGRRDAQVHDDASPRGLDR